MQEEIARWIGSSAGTVPSGPGPQPFLTISSATAAANFFCHSQGPFQDFQVPFPHGTTALRKASGRYR